MMKNSQQFTNVLRQWAEVFVRRSMRDFVVFSRRSGLSMSQIHVLFRLHHQGVNGGAESNVSDIGDLLGVTNAAASQLVDRLVQQGYLHRSESASDRRFKSLDLTLQGHALVLEVIEARRNWMEQLTTAFTPEQHGQIIAALTNLTEAALQLEQRNYHSATLPVKSTGEERLT